MRLLVQRIRRAAARSAGTRSAPLREAAAMKPPLALGAYGACVGYLKRLLLDKELVPLGSMAKWQPTDEVGSLASSPTPIVTMSGLEPAPGR